MDPTYLLGVDDDDDMDEEDIELLGELLGEDDPILGQRFAMHRRLRGGAGAGGRVRARRRLHKAMVPATPGVPKPGAREWPVGFSTIQFTETSALQLTMTARPQMPIKGRRLVIDAVRSAAGSGGLLTVVDLKVGQKSQLVSAQPLSVTTYAAGSFGVDMALDPAGPGVEVTLIIAASAQPGVGETVDIAATLIGLAIG